MAPHDLRSILQYVPQFQGRTFVIAADGGALLAGGLEGLALDLAVLQSLKVHVVLVYGSAAQIEAEAARRGQAITSSDGLGPSDDATLDLAVDVITRLTNRAMQALTAAGLRAASSNAIIARRAGTVGGIDQGHTGRIDKVDGDGLRSLLDAGLVPVVPALAFDTAGNPLRISSDEAAARVAAALGASKILFLAAEVPEGDWAKDLGHMSEEAALESARALPDLPPGFAAKLRHGARACEGGVARVHVLDGRTDEALLLELFSNEGIGAMIHADDYLNIRPATPDDIPEMITMMRPGVEDEQLLPRHPSELAEQIDDFHLIEVDDNPVACVAVHLHPDQVAELACLYVKRSHGHRGYGRRLIAFAEELAKEQGAEMMFALSTQAATFFTEKAGYRPDPDPPLPATRLKAAESSCRNATALVKEL